MIVYGAETDGKHLLFPSLTSVGGRSGSAQRGKLVGNAEQEDQPDDEAIGRPRPGNQAVEPGMVSAGAKCSSEAGRQQRIHGHQANGKCAQAQQTAVGSTQVCSQKE